MDQHTSNSDSSQPIPTAANLHSGTLPNQFQYFVVHNPTPKHRIIAHLVIKIGSLVETEDERGVAHFLEHLAFRGTKNFDHGELISFFESVGMSFGHHVNAHTGQCETIYKLSIPSNNDLTLLEKALDVLLEWANGSIRISNTDVEAERNIIEEEWRGRQGVSQRMLENYWHRVFADGGALQYANRWPIGTLEVVRNVTPKVIKDFYKKWYRPDTMALVLVGDFSCSGGATSVNIASVIDTITTKFGCDALPPACLNAPPIPVQINPKHVSGLTCAMKDKELTRSAINIEFFKPIVTNNTLGMVKDVMCKKVFTSILDRRLCHLSKSVSATPTPATTTAATATTTSSCCGSCASTSQRQASAASRLPVLLTGSVGVNPVVPSLERTTFSIQTRRGKEKLGMQLLINELVQITRHGCTNLVEFQMAVDKWKHALNSLSKDPSTSSSIATELKYLFCQNMHYTGSHYEQEMSMAMLNEIDLTFFNAWIADNFALELATTGEKQDRFYVVSSQMPEAFDVIGFDSNTDLEKTFQELLNKVVDNDTKTDHTALATSNETKESGTVVTAPVLECAVPEHKTTVIRETKMKSVDSTEWTLGNGIRVCFKRIQDPQTQAKKKTTGGVQFQAFALRGRSELNEQDDAMFCFLPDLVADSGLGNLDAVELSDMRSAKSCRVNVQKHLYFRGLGGSTKSHTELELMFQQIYLTLTRNSVKLNKLSLEVMLNRTLDVIQSGTTIEAKFVRQVQKLLFGEVQWHAPLTSELLEQVTISKMQKLYDVAFTEMISNYIFCFTGDIPEESIFKALVEKYLGALGDGKSSEGQTADMTRWSLPSTASPADIGITLPSETIEYTMYERVANKATSMLCMTSPEPLPYDSTCVDHVMKLASQVLRNRLLSVVRQQQSDIYNISVEWTHSHMSPHGAIVINWSCLPSNADRIRKCVVQEIGLLKNDGPTDDELHSVLAIERNRIVSTKENKGYWLFHLLDGYKTEQFVKGKEASNNASNEEKEEPGAEYYIFQRSPRGALERVNSLFSKSFVQSHCQTFMNVDTMLYAVLGPKSSEEESKM